MRRYWIVALLLLCMTPLSAQVEFNVQVRESAGDLRDWWEQQERLDPTRDAIPAGLRARYTFLVRTRLIKALATGQARRDPEIRGLYTLRMADGDARQMRTLLENSGAFEFVEPNRTVQLDWHPQDATPPNDDSIAAQWYHPFVRTFEAWETTRGRRQIKIGIIDTGLDYDHPEFEGQVAINSAEDANGNGRFDPWPSTEARNGVMGDFDGIDNDNNGFADDVIGYDFTDQPRSAVGGDILFPDPDPLDDNNHGTLVAGVIGAKPDNSFGGTGLAPGCEMVVLRAFSSQGDGEDDDIARAIIYGADNGVQVLNLSFGDNVPSNTTHAAIRYAYSKGVIMVASAGNGTGDEIHYPSGYDEVISVSASAADIETGREFLWPLSSFGVTVDLCAPGSGILTTTIRDTLADGTVEAFTRTQGTSFSAPMVASAAGLLLSERSYMTPQQVRGILTSSTDDISTEGWDHLTGAGRLNMERALSIIGTSNVQLLSPQNDGGSRGDSVWITGTVL
ncbi:MAG: S8 family serine peptidase, partial [Bacteroidota bacterium]